MSGARCYGSQNGNCKYSNDMVEKVRAMKHLGYSYSEIARITGIPYSSVRDMVKVRKTLKELEIEKEDKNV